MLTPSLKQLGGLDDGALQTLPSGHRLLPEVADAFARLQQRAAVAGFELQVASSYRDFHRQLSIWNGKARGERAVHDDAGAAVDMAALPAEQQALAILRFSALPGTSRHHWGTDLDVYDAAAVPADYQVGLTPQEVAPGGVFDAFHCWLDERIAADESDGFFRPYNEDRGGVAAERWHLSYAPLAQRCAQQITPETVGEIWRMGLSGEAIELAQVIEPQLAAIMKRFVEVPSSWCPAAYRN